MYNITLVRYKQVVYLYSKMSLRMILADCIISNSRYIRDACGEREEAC